MLTIIVHCIIAFVLAALCTLGVAWIQYKLATWRKQRKARMCETLERLAKQSRMDAVLAMHYALERARAEQASRTAAATLADVQAELNSTAWEKGG